MLHEARAVSANVKIVRGSRGANGERHESLFVWLIGSQMERPGRDILTVGEKELENCR